MPSESSRIVFCGEAVCGDRGGPPEACGERLPCPQHPPSVYEGEAWSTMWRASFDLSIYLRSLLSVVGVRPQHALSSQEIEGLTRLANRVYDATYRCEFVPPRSVPVADTSDRTQSAEVILVRIADTLGVAPSGVEDAIDRLWRVAELSNHDRCRDIATACPIHTPMQEQCCGAWPHTTMIECDNAVTDGELLPCPFCGGTELEYYAETAVICNRCCAHAPKSYSG